MKVSGFTFVRNAIKYDYPVEESIRSILPFCDEVVVAVGNSDDNTRDLVASIDPGRVRIIDTVWDESLRKGGVVLAKETDKALAAISPDADWAFYIQADEVVHEAYREQIRQGMEECLGNTKVDGLILNYRHFWGSYEWVGDSRKWYRREIRIIKPNRNIHSYKDAQGFRRGNQKIRVKLLDAWIYHYGWVKPPSAQQAKLQEFNKLWHDEAWIRENLPLVSEFDYSNMNSLSRFTGEHPDVMQSRIAHQDWKFEPQAGRKHLSFRHHLLDKIEKKTGWRIGEFRNYKLMSE